jgi:hypothetical protein
MNSDQISYAKRIARFLTKSKISRIVVAEGSMAVSFRICLKPEFLDCEHVLHVMPNWVAAVLPALAVCSRGLVLLQWE